ncbi:reverse transcriptase domain-containing protein [Tanacetum coccineum]
MLKFLQIFQRLHFNISFADALLHIPKFTFTFKSLRSNKEKLFELENTSLTENCLAVLLKKLLKKLGDPGKFLIPCDFQELKKCMALADLAGIAEDVFVQAGKFTFLADFVVVDYDVDPCVPLILGRPFLRTARALVDVCGEELILRDRDEILIFHADSTTKHPQKPINESINMINLIDITYEDRFEEELKIKKSNHPISGSTTSLSDSSPSLIPFETSDSLLEEFADELALLDQFPPGNKDDNFDSEADLREIEYSLNQDPSTDYSLKVDIDSIDPVLKRFTDEPALVYSSPPGDDDDDLFYFNTDNKEWKKFLYGDPLNNFDLKIEKNKDLKMECLIDNMDDKNEDKVFNPGILSLGKTQIFYDNSKDKDLKVNSFTEALLILEENNFPSHSSSRFSDHELLFFLEYTMNETLLSFLSENDEKDFNPGQVKLVTRLTKTSTSWEATRVSIFFLIAPDYEDSRARGFVHCSLEFQSLS